MNGSLIRKRTRFAAAAILTIGFLCGSAASAQGLPDTLIAQIRAGASRLTLSGDSTSVALVGSPTVPSIEVMVNGRGPFRFLIDLGSNVIIFRKNVIAAAGGRTIVRRAGNDVVSVDSIRFGAALLERVVGGAYDTLDVDGVLGYNALRSLSFTLDYPGLRFSLHRRQLPIPDGRSVLAYQVIGRMPFVWVKFGKDSLLANLDTGAADWFTVPSAYRDSVRWSKPPTPGPTVWNNQVGTSQVMSGQTIDSLSIGPLHLPPVVIYVNASVDTPWLGSASMRFARWTFDPVHQRLEIGARPERRP